MKIARLLVAVALVSLAGCATTSAPLADRPHEFRNERRDAR